MVGRGGGVMVGRGGEGGAVILLRGCFWFYFPPQTVLCNRLALWRSVLLEAESGGVWRAGSGGGGLAGGAWRAVRCCTGQAGFMSSTAAVTFKEARRCVRRCVPPSPPPGGADAAGLPVSIVTLDTRDYLNLKKIQKKYSSV